AREGGHWCRDECFRAVDGILAILGEVAGHRNDQPAAAAVSRDSRSSRARLRSTPQAYPESEPSSLTTRWQGIATARLLAAHALLAMARVALGAPIRLATSA